MFTADQVWGCAVAADRINGGYFKDPVYAQNLDVIEKQTNKSMVKDWLRNNAFGLVTEADIEKGREVRHFFNGFLLKELSGKINDFEHQALKIAQMDEFTNRNMLEFAIISCLPTAMLREQGRKELDSDIRNSTQLTGAVGAKIEGDVEVVKSFYSKDYAKFRITAKLVDSFVDFWYNSDMKVGDVVRIKAKIKSVRSNNTTQLNYVKKIG
jgi:hypothetical protein